MAPDDEEHEIAHPAVEHGPTADVDEADEADDADDADPWDESEEPEPEEFDVEMPPPPPPPAVGRMIGAAMVGLHGVIYGEKEQPAVVMQADGAPPRDDEFDLDLDPDDPSASRMVVRRPGQA